MMMERPPRNTSGTAGSDRSPQQQQQPSIPTRLARPLEPGPSAASSGSAPRAWPAPPSLRATGPLLEVPGGPGGAGSFVQFRRTLPDGIQLANGDALPLPGWTLVHGEFVNSATDVTFRPPNQSAQPAVGEPSQGTSSETDRGVVYFVKLQTYGISFIGERGEDAVSITHRTHTAAPGSSA